MKPTARGQPVTTFDVLAHIHSYEPRTEPAKTMWHHGLRAFTVEHLGDWDFPSTATMVTRVAMFAKYTAITADTGCDLDIEEIWHPARVDHYVVTHPGSRGDKAALGFMARRLTTKAPWPPVPAKDTSKVNPWKPYTTVEIDRFWRLAPRQRNSERCLIATAMLALGLGAGIRSDEIPWVQVRDIHFTAAGVTVQVGEPWPRHVPVIASLEPVFAELCEGRNGDEFLTGKNPKTYSGDYRRRLMDRPKGDGTKAPTISVARLRATWVYRHLQRGVPLGDVMAATGHIDVRTLNHIIADLTPHPTPEHHQLLKGTAP